MPDGKTGFLMWSPRKARSDAKKALWNQSMTRQDAIKVRLDAMQARSDERRAHRDATRVHLDQRASPKAMIARCTETIRRGGLQSHRRRETNYCGSEQFQVKEFNDEDGNPPLSIQEGSDSRDDRLYTKCSPTKVLSRSNPSGTPALRQVVQPKPKSTALFVPYHTYKPSDDFIINDIERYMGGSFSTDTIRAQQVYIYRFCGYLKVGYSYWAARRKQIWNRRHTKKFTDTRWSSHDVPCARIIEGLILRLKAKDQMKIACGECTNKIKWHQEFVSGSWGDVVSIILALKRFFNQSDRFFSEGNGRWRVHEDALLELVRLCGDLLRRRCRS